MGPSSDDHSDPAPVVLQGVPLDRLTEAEAVALLSFRAQNGLGTWVVTPHLDHLRRCASEPELRRLVNRADLRLADGMPLIWASRIAGDPLPERVAGSALVWSISAELGRAGLSLALLGADPGVAERAGQILSSQYPGLDIAGAYCPPFGFEHDDEAWAAVCEWLRRGQPDVVYVALGFPKQDHVIARLREVLPSAVFMGVGISLSFITGDVPRSPTLLRNVGLEWVWRLAHEPRRLFRRYLVYGLPFAARLLGGAALGRVRRRG